MSNAGEAALLRTPIHVGDKSPNFDTRRGQIAEAIHDGVLRYFGALGPPPTPTPAPTRTPRPPRFPDIMPPGYWYWW